MKRLATLAALAGVLLVTAPANAQSRFTNPDCNILCSPVFVLQPGAIITNLIDAPEGVDTETEFLARFTTAFGTGFNPLFFAFLIQWTPANSVSEGSDAKANSPALVYGPGLHTLGGSGALVDMGSAADVFALDLLPLGVYAPSVLGPSDYAHILALEADLFIKFAWADPEGKAPYLSSSNIYVIVDYLTDAFANAIPEGSDASRWVVIIGATLPLAPIPGG